MFPCVRLVKIQQVPREKMAPADEALLNAASQGNLYEVKQALLKGANVNCNDGTSGNNPLMWASFNGHVDVIRHLLKKGASLEALSLDQHKTPLLMAAYRGHAEIIDILLSRGADVNAKNVRGDTALHLAAYMGHDEAVLALLVRHPNLESTTVQHRYTPLHMASMKGSIEIVGMLIHAGASVTAVDAEGRTSFMEAVAFSNIDTIDVYLKYCPKEFVDSSLEDALASEDASHRPCDESVEQCQGGSRSNFLNLFHRDRAGNSVLSIAVKADCLLCIEKIISDINMKNLAADGIPSDRIAESGVSIQYFLEMRNIAGETAFFLAALQGRLDIARTLVLYGASYDTANNEGMTAFEAAQSHEHNAVSELLSQLN